MHNAKASKVKEFIFRNFPLKILALVLAVVIWIIVVNVDNPVKTTTISGVSVTLLNAETLEEKGYTYQVESGSVISIVVKAPQTIVDDLKSSDFYAYADLSQRTDSDACKIYVSCTKEEAKSQVDIVSLRTEYVQLNIDNKISKDFAVTTEYTGNPESGYIVSDVSSSPSTITVTGAETTINSIDHVTLSYDITNMNQSIAEDVTPVFYDTEGNIVDTSRLELSRDTIRMDVTILPTKSITINYALSGELPEDYKVESTSANITAVTIAGTKEDLANISSLDIPAGGLDITGLTEDTTLSLSLQTYLSNKYFIVSEVSLLEVTVKICHTSSVTIEIPYTAIAVRDLSDGYTYEIIGGGESGAEGDEGTAIAVVVTGEDSAIEKLTAEGVYASISLSGKTGGTYEIPLTLATGDAYTIEGTYFALVKVTKHEEETSEEESFEEGTTGASGEEPTVEEGRTE